MTEVFFYNYARGRNPLRSLDNLLIKAGFEFAISPGTSVAIKLHMGELGNVRYLRPAFVRRVVDAVKAKGGRPFLFDTIAAYPGGRNSREKYLATAAGNGFTEASVGAPVIIGDNSDEYITVPLKPVNNCHMTEVKVPNTLLNAATVVMLTHFKGHELAGFGGALKNMGMGCVGMVTKRSEHSVNIPEFDESAECNACGKCVEACPEKAIDLVNERPRRDSGKCIACLTCLYRCPSHCWVFPPHARERLQVGVAHAASGFVSAYRSRSTGKLVFVNFLQDITASCDCGAYSGATLVPDIGITCARDPVAIDKASLDLVDQGKIIPGSTDAVPPDILGKTNHTDSYIQIGTAEKLGTGSQEYKLVAV